MDRRDYKSKPFHVVQDARNKEINKVVLPSNVEVGNTKIEADLTVFGDGTFISGSFFQISATTSSFASTNVTSASFYSASFASANFTNITSANITSASFYSASFTSANFATINANQASITSASFYNASFTTASFSSSSFYGLIAASGTFTNMNVMLTGTFANIHTSKIRATSASLGQVFDGNNNLMLGAARPDSFPGLQWWLEADTNVTTVGSPARVTDWSNVTNDGKKVAQGTASARPFYQSSNTSVSGSKPSIDFQSAQIMSSSATCAISTFTMIIAMDNKTNGAMLVEHSPDLNSNDGHWFGSFVLPTGPCMEVKRTSVCAKDQTSAGQAGAWATSYGGPALYTMQHGGTSGSLRLQINNVDQNHITTTTANNLGTASTTQTLFLGARSGVILPSSGSWFAFILYTPAIPLYQAQEVVRYLGLKWGIPIGGF